MGIYLLGALFILSLLTLVKGVRIIRQYERGLVLRFGKYVRTADSGVNIIIPYLEQIITVDMREQLISVAPQRVITKDNATVTVDAVIYYKVVDPVKAQFEVVDFDSAATTLAQTNLRNVIGDKQLDEALTARDVINENLREVLDDATNSWGVKVTRVEVQQIEPPVDITEAMSRQMKAERDKRAAILTAEGSQQSAILEARGEAQAKLLRAEAEAEAIKKVADAAERSFTDRAQIMKRLEVAEKVLSGNQTKWILPTNSDLINVLNLDGKSNVIPVRGK